MTAIGWTTTDLTRTEVESILGAACIARIESAPSPVGSARVGAVAAWDANDRELHAAYASLAVQLNRSLR